MPANADCIVPPCGGAELRTACTGGRPDDTRVRPSWNDATRGRPPWVEDARVRPPSGADTRAKLPCVDDTRARPSRFAAASMLSRDSCRLQGVWGGGVVTWLHTRASQQHRLPPALPTSPPRASRLATLPPPHLMASMVPRGLGSEARLVARWASRTSIGTMVPGRVSRSGARGGGRARGSSLVSPPATPSTPSHCSPMPHLHAHIRTQRARTQVVLRAVQHNHHLCVVVSVCIVAPLDHPAVKPHHVSQPLVQQCPASAEHAREEGGGGSPA